MSLDQSYGRESGRSLRERAAQAGQSLQETAGDIGARAQEELMRARQRSQELARSASTRLQTAGQGAVTTVKRKPIPFGLAALAGIGAAVALSNPKVRNAIVELVGRSWNAVQARRGSLRL